ncbi:EAL domain-containing protein [Mycolicibacterium madagascariense]|nr:EAL domain-containing protein [Mycolicibacterium madagascariense]
MTGCPTAPTENSDAAVLDVAASGAGLEPAFQPVVALDDRTVVGFEALARWPGLGNPNPQAVFARARATGRLDHLDRASIDSAIDTALALGLARGTLLMVNCEPTSAYLGRPRDSALARAHDEFQLMFELTERHLLAHPRALLDKVVALRADGFAVALDDVGAHPDSLALLDVICPDIVKLDMQLVQSDPGEDQTRTLSAVLAHHERTGSILLAEGIESEEHCEQALALGATLGQGYLFGRAEATTLQASAVWSPPPMKHPIQPVSASPFDTVAAATAVRTARKATLIPFSRHIEAQAENASDPSIVLTTMQRAANFSGSTRDRYATLAATCPLVAVFGRGLPVELGAGVRGVDLAADDPLCTQWIVVVLGPHHAAALVARERPTEATGPEGDRRFDLVITHDRVLVTIVARSLLGRIP